MVIPRNADENIGCFSCLTNKRRLDALVRFYYTYKTLIGSSRKNQAGIITLFTTYRPHQNLES